MTQVLEFPTEKRLAAVEAQRAAKVAAQVKAEEPAWPAGFDAPVSPVNRMSQLTDHISSAVGQQRVMLDQLNVHVETLQACAVRLGQMADAFGDPAENAERTAKLRAENIMTMTVLDAFEHGDTNLDGLIAFRDQMIGNRSA